jgi:hypothetical protein
MRASQAWSSESVRELEAPPRINFPRGLKPAFLAALGGTAEQVAEKLGTADSSGTNRSGSREEVGNRLLANSQSLFPFSAGWNNPQRTEKMSLRIQRFSFTE